MTPRRLIPILSVVAALAAVVYGVTVFRARQVQQVDSEMITRPAPELGHHAHQLIPNLDGARMVVPDRPHDPQEIRAADRATRVTRLPSSPSWRIRRRASLISPIWPTWWRGRNTRA